MRAAIIVNACKENYLEDVNAALSFLSATYGDAGESAGVFVYVFTGGESETREVLADVRPMMPVEYAVVVEQEAYDPEAVLSYLKGELADFSCVVFSNDRFGGELCPRLAVRLGGSSLVGVQSALLQKDGLVCKKKIYSAHRMGRYLLKKEPYVIAIEGESFAVGDGDGKATTGNGGDGNANSAVGDAVVQPIDIQHVKLHTKKREITKEPLETATGLNHADDIVICGMGVGTKENAAQVASLATRLDAEYGATRPAVMSAFFPMSRLVGVSGVSVSPKRTLLLGVSGAPAFFDGVKASKKIIAINSDIDAPVMKKADLAICGDAMEIFTQFVEEMEA